MVKSNAPALHVRDLSLYRGGSLQLGDVQSYKNIALVPLIGENSNLEYLVFEDALNNGLKINETSNVPTLRMQNKTDKDVLILQGEYVIGGRQNRMIARNIFMEKNFEGDIPVSCVEQGRWSYDSPRRDRPISRPFPDVGPLPHVPPGRREPEPVFRASGFMATKNICYAAQNQGEVWGGVKRVMANLSVDSETGNFGETYKQREKDIDDYLSHFEFVPESLGMIVANERNGVRMYGLDIFDKSETMGKNFKKLLGSYILEAMISDGEIRLTKRATNDFLKQIGDCDYSEQQAISLGRDFKINGNIMEGSTLIYESIPLYVSVGSRPESNRDTNTGRRPNDPFGSSDNLGGNFSTGFSRSRF